MRGGNALKGGVFFREKEINGSESDPREASQNTKERYATGRGVFRGRRGAGAGADVAVALGGGGGDWLFEARFRRERGKAVQGKKEESGTREDAGAP